MANASIQQGFPQIGSPLVGQQGNILQPWLQLLVTLWNRTGGSSSAGNNGPNPGEVTAFAGPNTPLGWLVCDGDAVSRNTYPALFLAIGTTWGAGNGTTTFNLPNLQDKVIRGSGTLGAVGGSDTVTLGVPNLASHTHTVTDPGHTHAFTGIAHTHTVTDPGHGHTVTDPGHFHSSETAASNVTTGSSAGGVTSGNTGSNATGLTVNSNTTGITNATTVATGTNDSDVTGITNATTGAGTPFSIVPSHAALTYIIKT